VLPPEVGGCGVNPLRRFRRAHRRPIRVLDAELDRLKVEQAAALERVKAAQARVDDLLPIRATRVEVGDRWGFTMDPDASDELRDELRAGIPTTDPSTTREEPTMTGTFVRVADMPPDDPIAVADPIIRNLDRSGRSGMLEAIATSLDTTVSQAHGDGWTATNVALPHPATLRTSARWLRIIAARGRRA
jgi:hypothetical protein